MIQGRILSSIFSALIVVIFSVLISECEKVHYEKVQNYLIKY